MNKIVCRTLKWAFFFLCVLLFFGTKNQALEKVDPYAIKEHNNLELYHDSDSLKSITVTGINGYKILDEYQKKKDKTVCWSKVNDLKASSKIVVHYEKVGKYVGREIDCDVTFSQFVGHAGINEPGIYKTINGTKYYNYLQISSNIYRGFFMQSINVMNVQLAFNYSGTKMKVKLSVSNPNIKMKNINLANTFLSVYSLNGQYQQRVSWFNDNNQSVGERNLDLKEFVGYEKMNELPYYVTTDTACGEYNAPAQSANKLCSKVVGGRAEKNYSSNDHFTDSVGSNTYHRSGVTFSLKGEAPTFMVGANSNQMMFSFDSALLWTPTPQQPTKEIYDVPQTKAKEHNIDRKIIKEGSDVYYHINQTFDALTVNSMNKYQALTITDTFDNKNFDLVMNGKEYDGALWLVEANGKWKKVDSPKLSLSGNKILYSATKSFLEDSSNYGKKYVLQLHMIAKNDASGIAKNVAGVTFNNNTGKGTQQTNTVESYFPIDPLKQVTQNGVDVNGRNDGEKGTPTAYLNAGSEVQYLVTQKWHTKGRDIELDHYKQFSIQDPIEARLTYKEGSAQVIDKSTGKDITSEGTLIYDGNSKMLKWEASADFLNKNLLNGREIQLIFTVKTPLNQELNIENQAKVLVEDVEKVTNVVTIGVRPDLPLPIISKTGSMHLIAILLVSLLLFVLATFSYVILKFN